MWARSYKNARSGGLFFEAPRDFLAEKAGWDASVSRRPLTG
jgi:hypothetical protein